MKGLIKKSSLLILMLLMVFTLAACGGADNGGAVNGGDADTEQPGGEEIQKLNLKIALEEVKGDPEAVYAEKFKEILEKQSDGALTVEVFYLGQLGDGTDQVELCQNGAIEMTLAAACATGSLVPESNVFGVHYLFPDSGIGDVQAFLDNSEGVALVEEAFAENNLHTLGWTSEGYNLWCMKDKITTPQQMKGYKMRTMPAPIYTAFYDAYGANSTTVAFSETYSALQLNMVNGISNPIAVNYSTKYHEVTKYLIDAGQDLYIFGTFINKKIWDGLNDATKTVIEDAVKETNTYYNANYLETSTEELTKKFIESGVEHVILTPEERQAFKDIAKDNWDSAYGDLYGARAKQILELLKQEIEALL